MTTGKKPTKPAPKAPTKSKPKEAKPVERLPLLAGTEHTELAAFAGVSPKPQRKATTKVRMQFWCEPHIAKWLRVLATMLGHGEELNAALQRLFAVYLESLAPAERAVFDTIKTKHDAEQANQP